MTAAAEVAERPLFPRVDVAQVGDWWTFDAPSLSIAAEDGHYVSIWSVGVGPSVLLVPPSTDHGFWVPALPSLARNYTLHAIDRRRPRSVLGREDRRTLEARDVGLAGWAVGAQSLVAYGEGAILGRDVAGPSGVPAVLFAADDLVAGQDRSIVEIPIEGELDRFPVELGGLLAEALEHVVPDHQGRVRS